MVVQEGLLMGGETNQHALMSLIEPRRRDCMLSLTQHGMETDRLARRLILIELVRLSGQSRMRRELLLFATSRTQDEERLVSRLLNFSPADSSLFFPSPE